MIVLYLFVILLYVLLLFLSFHERLPEKDGKKVFFEKGAAYLYRQLDARKMLRYGSIKEKLRLLNPGVGSGGEKEKIILQQFYIKRIRLVLLFVLVGDLLAIALFVSSRMESVLSDGRYITRNACGLGSIEAVLQAKTEQNGGEKGQDFLIKVEEQQYGESQIKMLAQNLKEELPKRILGGNVSLEEIRSPLHLMQKVDGYPFDISWDSSHYALIYPDGSVENGELEETGETVNLTAQLTYKSYREEFVFPVHVLPPLYSEEEIQKKKLHALLLRAEEENRSERQMELPDYIDGVKVEWSEKRTDDSKYLFFLICICAGLIYFLQEKKLKEKADERNRQMLLDYPALVSRLTLYMGAGMTIRNAFCKIAFDYRSRREKGEACRYVYEEMLLTCYELDGGISETAAYENFGKRCRLAQYTKFSGLLVQNLRKGSNSLSEVLRQEAGNAFEERRNMARKMGEEAGTKLLFPMMLMLGIVMVLIIVPAYFSFAVS